MRCGILYVVLNPSCPWRSYGLNNSRNYETNLSPKKPISKYLKRINEVYKVGVWRTTTFMRQMPDMRTALYSIRFHLPWYTVSRCPIYIEGIRSPLYVRLYQQHRSLCSDCICQQKKFNIFLPLSQYGSCSETIFMSHNGKRNMIIQHRRLLYIALQSR